jgi:hypothetical protein
VASLAAEIARLNGQQVTLEDAPGAAGGEVVDAAAVITQHLVSFRSLQELVAQNTQLRCARGAGGRGGGAGVVVQGRAAGLLRWRGRGAALGPPAATAAAASVAAEQRRQAAAAARG